jgi:hypothetical protein
MGKRPSNTLFYVLISLAVVFGLYIVGGFILDVRRNDSSTTRQWLGQADEL